MAKSMTGFGRSEIETDLYQIVCEMKGVNHRFFDFNVRMPRRYGSLEDRIREKVKTRIVRGRIEVSFNIEKTGDLSRNIKVDNELAMAYHNSLKDLAQNLQIAPNFSVLDVFRLPEVFSLEEAEDNLESLWEGMERALDQALESLIAMREKEGAALIRDILERNAGIVSETKKIEERSPLVVKEYAERLKKRLAELHSDVQIDENRIAQEIAIFADRASITEEIVRLNSHCEQMAALLSTEDASVGRKCDFLIQEMFREVNTIASKANDLQISRTSVDLKAELEKMREQLQNIE
ncbi:MAG: YicC/YloC family endoribonuclease [Candidatus Saccharibacteria bacterium]